MAENKSRQAKRATRQSAGQRRSSKPIALSPIQKVLLGGGMMAGRQEPIRRTRRMRDDA